MSFDPLFSIIIPTFNAEATVCRALDSVINQSLDDFEIVIVDGLSTDRTIKLINTYKPKSTKVRVYTENDNGIYDAMNKGIKLAQGDWLYFLGSDDCLYDNLVLEKIYEHIKSKNSEVDVFYGNVYSRGHSSWYDGEFTSNKLIYSNICHQAIFYNQNVFNRIGEFDCNFVALADWHNNIKWFYNKNIKNQYLNLVIADFAAGGLSEMKIDQKFLEKRHKILVRYGLFKISIDALVRIVTKIVKRSKEDNHYIDFVVYGTLLFFLKFKKSWKRPLIKVLIL